MKAPTSRAIDTPKQIPGRSVGRRTPSDIPTKPAPIDKTHRATIARSNPTGTKRGSRYTNVTKADKTAESRPEK